MARTRVLIVDDSAFARKVIREIVAGGAGLEVVGIARDGLDALEKIASLKPDVITLDLNMPDLDGVGVLRALRALPHRPGVVVVSMSDGESDLGVQALAEGAFDVVHKPTALATDRLYDLADELRAKVRAAAPNAVKPPPAVRPPEQERSPRATPRGPATLLVVGASTGGPQAISRIVRALPRDFAVPVAIVLHMPEGYTEAFARRLDGDVALDVIEARDGLPLRAGLVVIGRAGMHLTIERASDGAFAARLGSLPDKPLHRPSVDELFRSAAAAAGAGVLALVLTGMGEDGLAGARAIDERGGTILTEAESSAVVYGMPRAVFEAGLATAEAPLDAIPALLARYV